MTLLSLFGVRCRSYVLTAQTVFDDVAAEQLYGNGGTDWFFYRAGSDVLHDQKRGEIATTI